MMKAVAVLEKGSVGIVELPRPEYGEYECLVRNRACGFCSSTDMKIIHNDLADMDVRYPTILGHEGAGEIVAAGGKVKNFRVGDRVTCARGVCPRDTGYSFTWGEMAEYTIVHDVYAMAEAGIDLSKATPGKTLTTYPVRKIPAELSYEDAVMILSFEENYSALLNFGVKAGMEILLYGDGTIAMGLTLLAKKIIGAGFTACVGHHDDKLALISAYAGADCVINAHTQNMEEALSGRRFDLVIDAVGSIAVVKQGLRLLKNGGKMSIYGVPKKEHATLNLFDMPNNTMLHMLTWPEDEHSVHGEVVDLIRAGQLVPKDFYTDVLPFTQIQQAIDLIQTRKARKVILTF
ncbi:MAG: zinc-binding dehydrogenase [Candidatus Pelethousia sp.]|nr:zinc-binding dehydrogenase [Candidatus Pelethousia sp.]